MAARLTILRDVQSVIAEIGLARWRDGWTNADVANFFGVQPTTIRDWYSRGSIPFRFKDEVQTILAKRGKRADEALFKERTYGTKLRRPNAPR